MWTETSAGACSNCGVHPMLTVDKVLYVRASDGLVHCMRCRRIFVETRPEAGEPSDPWAWIDVAFKSVPVPMRRRLYRALSLVLHPDKGGSARAMEALNAAKERYG